MKTLHSREGRGSRRAWLLLALVSAAVLCSPATGADPSAPPIKTVRLLTVGNSFSANATRFLEPLAAGGGRQLIHRPIVVGGASLELHAGKTIKHEANAESPDGLYSGGFSLKSRLQEQPWDVVTIQQASRLSIDSASYQPFATQLRDVIHQYAPQARLLIHETWAYRQDDPWFTHPDPKSNLPKTQEEMYERLRDAYYGAARELNVGLIPVGDAFHLASRDSTWGYHPDTAFDFANAMPPGLPDQRHSLHAGWRWTGSGSDGQLKIDGHHANAAGEFLGACVFYEVLFEEDVRKNPFVPGQLDARFAAFLKETAHQAVALWNGMSN